MKSIKVGCAIIEKNGKILIAQRLPESHLAGYWEFPGGKCREGENMEDCLVRELREELGVEIKPERFLIQKDHSYPEKNVSLYFYYCAWVSGEPQCLECADFAWVLPRDLKKYKFPPADDEVIELIIESGIGVRDAGDGKRVRE